MKHIGKILMGWLLCMLSTIGYGQDFHAVRELANRRFPGLENQLEFQRMPLENGKDVFVLEDHAGKILVNASSNTAACKAVDWYVKHYLHQSISHLGDQVSEVKDYPKIVTPVKKKSSVKYRYALNYVTINYSFAFYTWNDWERELDWMALNGVNLMLDPVGTELVWYNTLLELGYTDTSARAFIPGEAFTAWWLMGNLQGWGGPMSMESITQQAELQKKILKRMRELGIQPILQGFYGMVPSDLSTQLPDFAEAPIADQGRWVGQEFQRPSILLPTSPHFDKVADTYYNELKKLYGNDFLFFGGEPFHEGGKPAGVSSADVAKKIQSKMQEHFPGSTWVLQGWQSNPSDAILANLDKKHTLIIELFGENTNNWQTRNGYNKTPFIWANVTNFGEKTGLSGKLQRFIDQIFEIRKSPYASLLEGIGIIPEGINNNPVVYDLTLDLAWHATKPDLQEWLVDYTIYRYGKKNNDIISAWRNFSETIYASSTERQEGAPESIFCARPGLDISSVSSWGSRTRRYDDEVFEKAVKRFLRAEDNFAGSETYQADKIDFLRQVWANKADKVYADLVNAIKEKDSVKITTIGSDFLDRIIIQDRLLANSRFFTLHRWWTQAQNFGKNLPDPQRILYHAKAQISFWGPDDYPQTSLRDYAHKEWNGVLGSLYYKRWKFFIDEAAKGRSVPKVEFYQMEIDWAKSQTLQKVTPLNKRDFKILESTILR